MVLILHSPWTRGYLFQLLNETRSYSLQEHKAAFLKKQNSIFSILAGIFELFFVLN